MIHCQIQIEKPLISYRVMFWVIKTFFRQLADANNIAQYKKVSSTPLATLINLKGILGIAINAQYIKRKLRPIRTCHNLVPSGFRVCNFGIPQGYIEVFLKNHLRVPVFYFKFYVIFIFVNFFYSGKRHPRTPQEP